MKLVFILFFGSCSLIANAQIITTVTGNGMPGFTGDYGPATAASIGYPDGCAFDKNGNFYFTTVGNDRVRKISQDGIISTVAGIGSSGYNGDGMAATLAELNLPGAVAIDKHGNIFIGDANNSRVRKVDAVTGIISSVAGNGTFGFGGDNGPATASILNGAENICFDELGNLYISDYENFRIRKIDTLGMITTVVGNGMEGYSGDDGMATAAMIDQADGLCADKNGNLYISDNSVAKIRKINAAGIITTIAGNGFAGPAGDGGPATAASLGIEGLVCDDYGNLFVSGFVDNDVRVIDKYGIIHTIAGTGVSGFSGDNGQATAAELSVPFGITLDTCGNVYIADKDNVRIRKIALNPMCINERVGTIKNQETLNICPNPTYDILNIDNLKTQATYRLLSIVGSVVQQGNLREGNNSIETRTVANGMYMIEVIDDEGKRIVSKIVKQ